MADAPDLGSGGREVVRVRVPPRVLFPPTHEVHDLKITGIVKQVMDEVSGTTAKGGWRKREFILETEGDYPKQICMVQWGDNIDHDPVAIGEKITVSIDLSSREYKDRWYTDVKAWKVEREVGAATMMGGHAPAEGPPEGYKERAAAATGGISENDDDLPF